jgi:hypothetical protein
MRRRWPSRAAPRRGRLLGGAVGVAAVAGGAQVGLVVGSAVAWLHDVVGFGRHGDASWSC